MKTMQRLTRKLSRLFSLSTSHSLEKDIEDRYARLREKRNAHAKTLGIRPYRIVSNRILLEMATVVPTTLPELGEIDGIGPHTVRTYGGFLLRIVEEAECAIRLSEQDVYGLEEIARNTSENGSV